MVAVHLLGCFIVLNLMPKAQKVKWKNWTTTRQKTWFRQELKVKD